MNLDSVIQTVLKKITPSEEENKKIHGIIEDVLAQTKKIIKPHDLSVVLAGSFTRDTWLAHKKEFDLFIQFPENTTREKLEKLGLEVGKKIAESLKGSYLIAYAEHPYVRSKIHGYDVDIVPCYKVASAEKIKSAVDRTPFHNEYLSKNLKKTQSAEVRLLKQLCKANGLYGSDLKTQGFSGYLCELLTIEYGNFKNLVVSASKWLPGQVFIDLGKKYSGDKKEFSGQPLIIIDPVDPKRNVAAALSPSRFMKFIDVCKELAFKPSISLFYKKEAVEKSKLENNLKKRETLFVGIKFKRPLEDGGNSQPIVDDIIYPQLRKTAKRVVDILQEYEFVCNDNWVWCNQQDCIMLIELSVWKLPSIRKVVGPPIFTVKHSEEFLKKYKSGRVWVEGDRWCAEVKRQFILAEDKIKDTLSESSTTLKSKGIASHMADSLAKGFKLLSTKEILNYKDKDLLSAVKEYLEHEDFVFGKKR
ncbi:MAG: CCA tRNA nucleotidyltransferase [Candidatus Aenigmarchaeota archaeon]|nr:CCA tRNA nucleotidyltransferase [Candidatus Aenigmarchaeota archaeon]